MRSGSYTVVRQHEPLRTPDGWTGQDKMLVTQIESLFDEIYARLGKTKNMADGAIFIATNLKKTIVVSASAPSDPVPGTVWIRPGSSATGLDGWKTADVFVHE